MVGLHKKLKKYMTSKTLNALQQYCILNSHFDSANYYDIMRCWNMHVYKNICVAWRKTLRFIWGVVVSNRVKCINYRNRLSSLNSVKEP